MNKGFWMPREAGCLAEENIGYENSSRIEQKRSHQWLMDTCEPGIFSSKKQAVEAVSDRPVPAVNVSQWDTGLGFQSLTGQFSDPLFGSDLIRSVNSVDKNTPSVGGGNLNIGIKEFGNQYGIDPSAGLSISSSCLNFGGIRKVKVNQVRDSDHGMPAASIGHSYSMSDGSDYNKNDRNITSGSTYNNGSDNTVAIGINKPDENLFSTGHIFNKGEKSFLVMGHNYGRGDESVLPINRPLDRGDGNFVTMGQTYGKDDGNLISQGTSYSKGNGSFTSMGPTYGKSGEAFTTVPSFDAGNSSSFGGFHVDPEPIPSGGIINSSNPLISNQNSAQGVDSQKDLTESNPVPLVNITQKHNAKNDTVVKNIEPKPNPTKKTSNKFPTNVKSLLSTGIFDGIPIKYCTWSRERYLQGVIKGTGYLCSCDVCKGQKALNAYEFERHAGGKSKHPNNHIFFENGKSIYGVVQELQNSPQEMLFDAIQTVAGTTINQRNFRIWKASYQAATLELQRIYGKDDDAAIPS
ncbi:hypothetical protein P8452_59058 [Trifolium repens]|nr:hypothetical protein P8452_59058 [Trifolium repens]